MATTLNITPAVKGKESKRFNAVISKSRVNKVSDVKKNKIFALVGKVMAKNQRSTTEQRQEWYKNRVSDQAYRDKLNNQGIVRYNKIQEFLRNYKIEKGCNDCSYNVHHVALDFDHIIGIKKINACNAKSIDQAKEEILKCEVVCSNCHRIRTYEGLQSLRK